MNAVPIAFEQTAFVFAVGVARGRLDAVESNLLDLHDKINDVLQTGTVFAATMHTILLSEQVAGLDGTLAVLTFVSEQFSRVVDSRADLKDVPELTAYWSEDLQEQLMDLLDELEDLQETIALRLSPEFQARITAALEQAESKVDADKSAHS